MVVFHFLCVRSAQFVSDKLWHHRLSIRTSEQERQLKSIEPFYIEMSRYNVYHNKISHSFYSHVFDGCQQTCGMWNINAQTSHTKLNGYIIDFVSSRNITDFIPIIAIITYYYYYYWIELRWRKMFGNQWLLLLLLFTWKHVELNPLTCVMLPPPSIQFSTVFFFPKIISLFAFTSFIVSHITLTAVC